MREDRRQSNMDSVLYEQREAIAADLVKSIQVQLDRLKAGIVIVNVNVQNVQVPIQVQAAFERRGEAGADKRPLKNEGQAYASDVIPRRRGGARLLEGGRGLSLARGGQAEGDARSASARCWPNTRRRPGDARPHVHRTMQQVYSNVTKGDGGQPQRLQPAVPAAGTSWRQQAEGSPSPAGAGDRRAPPGTHGPARATAARRERES